MQWELNQWLRILYELTQEGESPKKKGEGGGEKPENQSVLDNHIP